MSTLKEIEHKLNSLNNYIDHYVNRRINEELLDLNHYIMSFDQWYDATNNFQRNKIIANCGIRRTGRTRAMIENVIFSLIHGTKKLYIFLKNHNQVWYIIDMLSTMMGMDCFFDKKNKLINIKGLPDISIHLGMVSNVDQIYYYFRGRDPVYDNQIFTDHYTFE